ncbi:MAG TPA: lysophospholipid acyltransferase family protein [Candidatus Binatia bacterium]|nr:lysophospholipid acyltransferase family protein [Candidatus Binatia bacterium]
MSIDGRLRMLISWAATLVFLPVFATILLVFDGAQRVARLFGQRPQEHVAGALQRALVWAFRICDTRLVVERAPEVSPTGSYIVVSNHQSMFDIPIFGALLASNFPKYVSKRELARWIPSVSYNLRRGGHVLIDRSDAPSAIAAIRALGERVRDGQCSAVIFPEGTRARRGALGEFRRAGLTALLDAAPETPVVPIAIDESWRLLANNMLPVPWGVRVRVGIGAPIARRGDEDRAALIARVRDEVAGMLARWRLERGSEAA